MTMCYGTGAVLTPVGYHTVNSITSSYTTIELAVSSHNVPELEAVPPVKHPMIERSCPANSCGIFC